MKKLLLCSLGFVVSFILIFSMVRCEKDDICVPEEKKTPLLSIYFFDKDNTQIPKVVNNLEIVGTDFVAVEGHVPLAFNAVSEIKIPLKVDADETSFYFYLNARNTNLSLRNADKVVINYTRNDVYISRACGYKTNFKLNFLNPFVVSDAPDTENYPNGTGNWIQNVTIVNTEINQDETPHIYIYF